MPVQRKLRPKALIAAVGGLLFGYYTTVPQSFPPMTGNQWLNTPFLVFPFLVYALLWPVTFFFVWRYAPETRNKTLEERNSLPEAQSVQVKLPS
jgi:hypothetical protein